MAKKQQGYNPLDLTNEELRLRSKRMRKGTEAIKNRIKKIDVLLARLAKGD